MSPLDWVALTYKILWIDVQCSLYLPVLLPTTGTGAECKAHEGMPIFSNLSNECLLHRCIIVGWRLHNDA
jgi:hypothetical protein